VKSLSGLTQLRRLDLNRTKLAGAGLKELHGLKQLQTPGVARTQVTDTGAQELQNALPQLQIKRQEFAN
jgi:hypothetical protein